MFFVKLIFFFCLFMIFYVYVGYPLVVVILSRLINKRPRKVQSTPTVSILIAAFNEVKHIEATIRNKLELDYPKENLQIIVVSDASSDGTDSIVKMHETEGVHLIRQEPRAGKSAALNMAFRHAMGEILVFSDANSIFDRNALKEIVANFGDPAVGYVTGKMIYMNPDGSSVGDGCSGYMKYENFLRKNETMVGSVVGVDGGIDAMRKSLYKPLNPEQLPDFVLPLRVIEQGYRAVYESQAILREPTLSTNADEYRMRVRVSLRALWALKDMSHLLGKRYSAFFAWQLWSHKVLRYLCFMFLIGAYVSNLLLFSNGTIYKIFFVMQNVCYMAALIAPWVGDKAYNIFSMLNYFVLLNQASLHAFLKFILGKKQVLWTPRKG